MTSADSTVTKDLSPTVPMRVLELASRAPSIHNTQPWRWRWDGRGLELHADRSRQLRGCDPDGRNLVLSCGAALHHVQVASAALGWSCAVDRFPDARRPDLLARIELVVARPDSDATTTLRLLERRRTDRRRFTAWPVTGTELVELVAAAEAWRTHALPVVDPAERLLAELLVNRAVELQHGERRTVQEQGTWVDHGPHDGVPSTVIPTSGDSAGRRPSRFDLGLLDDMGGRDAERSDGLLLLHGARDLPADWLTAGEGLSALWLAATRNGMSVVPLSQVVEVPETRRGLRDHLLRGRSEPLLVVRLGWQAMGRSQLPRTPRRPVAEQLEPG